MPGRARHDRVRAVTAPRVLAVIAGSTRNPVRRSQSTPAWMPGRARHDRVRAVTAPRVLAVIAGSTRNPVRRSRSTPAWMPGRARHDTPSGSAHVLANEPEYLLVPRD